MTVARVRTVLTGTYIAGGGVSDMFFFGSAGDEDDMTTAVRNFWNGLVGVMALGTTAQVLPEVVNLNETTGALVSVVPVTPSPAIVTATSAGEAMSPATQGLCQWRTDGIVANRRVRGRTYLPATVIASTDDGVPNATYRTTVGNAMTTLIALPTPQLVIWSRPTGTRPGSIHDVTSGSCWTKWAVLRSRRD